MKAYFKASTVYVQTRREGASNAIKMHGEWKAKDNLSRLVCSSLELKMSQQREFSEPNSLSVNSCTSVNLNILS